MPITTLLFGSIGTLVETSDIQRRAYNQAMREAGLGWEWDAETYRDLLTQSGGRERLSLLARATGQPLATTMIERIHARKTELACAEIAATRPPPRPGVASLLALAGERGWKRGFVTSTEHANIEAILALGPPFGPGVFDVVVGRADVRRGKPDPEPYRHALARLGVDAADAIAIEDTASSLMAASRAGIRTVATPGAFAADQDFWQADLMLPALADSGDRLDPRLLALLDSD